MAFVSDRTGTPDIWLKNLESGRETPLTGDQTLEIQPEISSDGSWIAYLSIDPRSSPSAGKIQIVAASGGVPKTVCEGCGKGWDWGADNQRLIFRRDTQGDQAALYLLNTATGMQSPLLEHPSSGLFQGNFSPDGQWIAFARASPGCRVFIAPFRGESVIQEKEWFALSDGSSWDDKPRWSHDGNLLYFTSDRDGFVCLWAQRLDAATKRPSGAPFAVYHLHQARRSMANVGYGPLEISVARDKLVFNMVELTGNIWMTKLEDKP